MTTVLIRKFTAKPRFHPHYNTATGRYYGTAHEYVADLKRRGLEPYRPDQAERIPRRMPYHPSSWARAMVESIKNGKRSDGSVQLGDRFYESLKAHGGQPMTAWLRHQLPVHYQPEGGFDATD